MMQLNYNVTGTQRKDMVGVIATVVNKKPVYAFMPSCSYLIGDISVALDGTMTWDKRTKDTTIEAVKAALSKAGFKAAGTKATVTKAEKPEKKEKPGKAVKVKAMEITKPLTPTLVNADTDKTVKHTTKKTVTKASTKAEPSTLDAYFEELKRIGTEYAAARKIREDEKQKIIETKGPDSKELKAWYKREEKFPTPSTTGQMKAYRAWADSKRHNSSELECEDLPFEPDMSDFSDTLKAAGCKMLVVTERSSGLMTGLHALAAQGWTVDGLCTITRTEECFGQVETQTVQGIRISLK